MAKASRPLPKAKAAAGGTRKAKRPVAAKKAATKLPRRRAKATGGRKPHAAPPTSASSASAGAAQPMRDVAQRLRTWSGSALGMVGPMADMSLKLAVGAVKASASPATIRKTGKMLRQARETAGLTLQEVAQAVNMRDTQLLEQAEGGKVALPFEVILRLASIFGRHDPISFIMKITRASNPELWAAMEKLGIGKLAVHAGREREFVNIYRASDEVRDLSDKDFAVLLDFVSAAFAMGLAFHRDVKKAQ